jgi:hypothetical protein
MSQLTDAWNKLKKQLDQQDSKVLDRLMTAYGQTYEKITPDIESLIELIQAQLDAGKLTKASISKSSVYNKLVNEIEQELDDYSTWLKTEVNTAANDAAKQGLSAGKFLLLVALAESLGVPVNEVPRDMVNNAPADALSFLKAYLSPSSPLYDKINLLSPYHADKIAEGILERVGEGMNPRLIGEWITDAYGVGLTDSIKITRTVQLYSYRESNALMQRENAELLEGSVWDSELDDRVCMSCIVLHGTVYPAGTVCNDHHLGRCDLIPWVKGMPNPIEQTGIDWFNSQDENTQKAMMGESKYEAWKDEKFTLDQLSKVYNDPVYGDMRGEATLKDLIND